MKDGIARVVELRGCYVDLARLQVLRDDGTAERLTEREASLLGYLVACPGRAISRQEILHAVWGFDSRVVSRACDTTMARLRGKVERDPQEPIHLLTVYGEGYRFVPLQAPKATAPAEPVEPPARTVPLGNVTVDLLALRVVRHDDGSAHSLTPTEAAVLGRLAEQPGRARSRRELARGVVSERSRAIDNVIGRLRKKIEDDPAQPTHLLTVRGRGYRLVFAPNAAPEEEVALVLCRIEGVEHLALADTEATTEILAQVTGCLESIDPNVYRMGGTGRLGFAFPTVDAALAWCVAAQRALLAQAWPPWILETPGGAEQRDAGGRLLYRGPRVAMAVHHGTPQLLSGPDGRPRYAGAVASRVQEVAAGVHGGLVWITDEAWHEASRDARRAFQARAVRDQRPGGALWALVPSSLHGRRLRVPARAAGAWPPTTSSFVGRHAALERMSAWWSTGGRLLTVLGPGGIGKTRLAAKFASVLSPQPWWCDLEATRNAEEALTRLAQLLTLPDADPARIARVCQQRGATVVLDNVEQLTDFSPVLDQLLADAPAARWIVTSRRRLDLDGEEVLALGPLTREAARTLFEDRALRSGSPSSDPDLVGELVDRLDRFPLAIELAAAQTRLLGPADLLQRVSELLAAPGGPGRTRHATMRAVLEWSWTLASPAERTALAQLALFRGPFTVADAEALLAPAPGSPSALAVLDALQAQSLLEVRETPAGRRLVLLQSVREFAGEQLDDRKASFERYVGRMASLGSPEALAATRARGGTARLHALVERLPDLSAALDIALEEGSTEEAVRCCLALCRARQASAKDNRGALRLVERTLGAPGLDPEQRAALWVHQSLACASLGEREAAQEAAERALATSACATTIIDAHRSLARVAWDGGDVPTSTRHLEAALDHSLRAGDAARAASARGTLARTIYAAGDPERAMSLSRQAMRELEEAGSEWELSWQRIFLGWALNQRGRFAEARALLEGTLPALEAIPDLDGLTEVHQRLGIISGDQGDLEGAVEHFRAAIDSERDAGSRSSALLYSMLAIVQVRQGDLAGAASSEARAVADLPDSKLDEAVVYANLAATALEANASSRALEYVATAQALEPPSWVRGSLLRMEAQVLLDQGDARAAEVLEAAENLARSARLDAERVHVLCLRGRLAADRGEDDDARAALAEAVDLAGAPGRDQRTAPGRAIARLRERLAGDS